MTELFTTPRENEAKVVREILRSNNIHYISREEIREYGARFCIYVPEEDIERAVELVDEGLSERGM
jgi:type III secretory pathway lipoprotein EscJ